MIVDNEMRSECRAFVVEGKRNEMQVLLDRWRYLCCRIASRNEAENGWNEKMTAPEC